MRHDHLVTGYSTKFKLSGHPLSLISTAWSDFITAITYVVKGLMPSNSARYTKSVELHYESGKMKTRRFLLLRVSC